MSNLKLSERAMLALCHIGTWSGTNYDAKVSDEVMTMHKADKDAGRYKKQLIATRFFAKIGSVASTARQTHYLLTLPWADSGDRIMSAAAYPKYTAQMKAHRLAMERAADEFVKDLPDFITEAKTRLGTMFNAADYKAATEIRKKFYLDTEIKPLPEASDFRTKISDAESKAVVKDIERRTKLRLEQAQANIYERVAKVTGHMVTRLQAYDGSPGQYFHDSLVYNIKQVADLIPVLNISGDPKLDALRKQLEDELVAYSPEILRADTTARKTTTAKAEKILSKVKKFIA